MCTAENELAKLATGKSEVSSNETIEVSEKNKKRFETPVFRIFLGMPQCLMAHYMQVAVSTILNANHFPLLLNYTFKGGEYCVSVKEINEKIENSDAVIIIAGLFYGANVDQKCKDCVLFKTNNCKYGKDGQKCIISHMHYAQLFAAYRHKDFYLIEHKGLMTNKVDPKAFNKCKTECQSECKRLSKVGLITENCTESCKSKISYNNNPQAYYDLVQGQHKSFHDSHTLKTAIEEGLKYIENRLANKCAGLVVNSDAFDEETTARLKVLGIKDCTSKLKDTQFSPIACMDKVENRLWFLGVSGSKWIDEEAEKAFINMLEKVSEANGEVRFLLIDPTCEDFKRMKELRGDGYGGMSVKPYHKWNKLTKRFSACLKVKCYNKHLPLFRMQFIDHDELAISKYLFQEEQNKTAENGWQNPHLIIGSKRGSDYAFSLFPAFEKYFEKEWDAAADLATIVLPED